MKSKTNSDAPIASDKSAVHRVRIPGFVVDHDLGLGDVVKRATSSLGIKTCGGCEKRAAVLNRWMTFTR
jgi:hypothetical protein